MKIARLPSQRRKSLITTLIMVIGLPLLIYASYQVINLISNAGSDATPKNIVISNLTTSSLTISWTTETAIKGSVIPVLNGSEQTPFLDKRGNDTRKTHYVEITDLEPNTTYQYTIVSGSSKYSDTDGEEFSFKTAPVTSDAPTPNPIYGTVENISDDDTIIYAFFKNKSTYPVSAVVPSGGNWIMDLSTLRSISDKSLVLTNDDSTLVVASISGTSNAAIVEGSYSAMFDSNGKLQDDYALSITSNTSYYSYFPSDTQLTAQVQDDNNNDDDEVVTPVVTDPVVEEPEETDDEFERKYELASDLEWIDMVDATGSYSSSGVIGENSIVVTNLTDTGFTVVWVSESAEEGSIEYGTTASDLGDSAYDERDGISNKGEYLVHSVNVTLLETETDYYFKVISGTDEYDNNGNYYSVTTFATLDSPPAYESITGNVENADGEVVVIAYFEDKDGLGSTGSSMKMSTLTDENGKWIMSIADSRNEDGSEYYEYTDDDSMTFDVLSIYDFDSVDIDVVEFENDIDLTLDENTSLLPYSKIDKLASYGLVGL
jgi:hypothetical protein